MSAFPRRLEDRGQHSLGQRKMSSGVTNDAFDVDLSEFRLAVGPAVFVAKTLRDLKIFSTPAT